MLADCGNRGRKRLRHHFINSSQRGGASIQRARYDRARRVSSAESLTNALYSYRRHHSIGSLPRVPALGARRIPATIPLGQKRVARQLLQLAIALHFPFLEPALPQALEKLCAAARLQHRL